MCGLVAALSVFAYADALTILQPREGDVVETLSKRQREYLAKPLAERTKIFADEGQRAILRIDENVPTPTLVSWRWQGDGVPPTFTLVVSRNGVPVQFRKTREQYVFLDNFEIGADYVLTLYAKVGDEVRAKAERRFSTASMPPRLLRAPGVRNLRDLGGRVGLGGRKMRQGLLFRSAGLNSNPEEIDFLTDAECRAEFEVGTLTNHPCWQAGHMAKIFRGEWPANDPHRVPTAWARGGERMTDEGREILQNQLGIRTDLDLRGVNEVTGMAASPAGDRVRWAHVPMVAYDGLAKEKGKRAVKACFDILLDEKNYPVLFHCIGGQDRTGTLAYLVEGLLGVGDDDLARDWECSGFSNPKVYFRHEELYDKIGKTLAKYPGANTRERIEAYLKECGLTEADFATLRARLLEP